MASLTVTSSIPSPMLVSSRPQSVQPPRSISFAGFKGFTAPSSLSSQSLVQLQSKKRISLFKTYSVPEVDLSSQLTFTPEVPPVAEGKKQIIERLVLFIMLPGVPQYRIDALLKGLRDLATGDTVTFLTSGPLHRYDPEPYIFDIFLHARFKTYEDRVAYLSTGPYLNLHHELMDDICVEVLLQEWFADVNEQSFPANGGALRTSFFKLKEGAGEAEKDEVLAMVAQLENFKGNVLQHSYGKNFTPKPADHKGYSVACLSVFSNIQELNEFAKNEDRKLHMKRMEHIVDHVAHFDYVLPTEGI